MRGRRNNCGVASLYNHNRNMKYTIAHIIYCLVATAITISLLQSCRGAKLSEADEQYQRGEYFDAANTYRKVYNKMKSREQRPTRGMVAFKMGECYRRLNMSARASAAFQNALRYEYPDSMAYFYLARSQQAEGKYAAAIKNYETFLTYVPDHRLSQAGIEGCSLAIKWKDEPTRYIVKSARLFNSRRADFCPMYLDGSFDQLYFTSSTEDATGEARSEITGTKKSDIFFSKKDENGNWQSPEPVEGGLNTEFDEGITTFTPDGSTMYLAKARRELNAGTSVEIYSSQRSDAQWSEPVKVARKPRGPNQHARRRAFPLLPHRQHSVFRIRRTPGHGRA